RTIMIRRATERGEASPTADDLIDAIVAPMIYRILYSEAAPTLERVHQWVNRCLG
ncbi:TetR family transcriptional regulator, partial [Pseudomonas syringae pv. actinidiae]|nr:TetR family transcriptional regulator [Pseudomonas syringae pv. actinidiae]